MICCNLNVSELSSEPPANFPANRAANHQRTRRTLLARCSLGFKGCSLESSLESSLGWLMFLDGFVGVLRNLSEISLRDSEVNHGFDSVLICLEVSDLGSKDILRNLTLGPH